MGKSELERRSFREAQAETKISGIKPIEDWRGLPIISRGDLRKIIEAPFLAACEELYDKNITTLGSSANKKDIETGSAYIILNFDLLSTRNKEVTKGLGEVYESDGVNQVRLDIPVSPESTLGLASLA